MRLLHARHADARLPPAARRTRTRREQEIRYGIAGNLCRCTGYQNIVKAVQSAAKKLATRRPPDAARSTNFHAQETRHGRHVRTRGARRQAAGHGHVSLLRKEDARFIRGQGSYVDDIKLPGMLFGAIVRSPYAHARIKSIDKTQGAGRARAWSRC